MSHDFYYPYCDAGRFVGGNSYRGTHTHSTVGFHRSSASRIPGFGVFTQASADMYILGYGNTGTHGLTPIDVALVGLSLDDESITVLTLVYVVLVERFSDAKAVTGLTPVNVELVGPSSHAKVVASLMPVNVALVVLSTDVEAVV
ncbi:hypothetical protein RDI58_013139 [Solanum bulbocastanum]|uniref:Uncharacterized protein n=1 Tax=Solanum bulbocastanum TaxID=147425 RepID=A0AAN8YDT6_SOLBU